LQNNFLKNADLVNNPTARVPVCLCLDTSGSMEGAPINELNEGVRIFYDAIREDETAMFSAEICIITFGEIHKLIQDFTNIDYHTVIPTLNADGGTPMGEAVNLALDCLDSRKQKYKDAGVDYYQPWLVLMTDGEPNGRESDFERAVHRTRELVEQKKLTVFPIGIGRGADMNTLSKFSPKRSPLRLKGTNFKHFFNWLSQSVARTSQSMPGEDVKLDLEGIKGWAEL
jgi:uncharacterized protein YegL